MIPAIVASRAVLIGVVLLALIACSDVDPGDPLTASPPGTASVTIDGREVSLGNTYCTWFEGSGQLFVEAGDAEGADYLLLAAGLDWLGEPLPEGPAPDPELTLRIGGVDRPVDQASIEGAFNAAQTEGTFLARTTDGVPFSGEWSCPEVLEG